MDVWDLKKILECECSYATGHQRIHTKRYYECISLFKSFNECSLHQKEEIQSWCIQLGGNQISQISLLTEKFVKRCPVTQGKIMVGWGRPYMNKLFDSGVFLFFKFFLRFSHGWGFVKSFVLQIVMYDCMLDSQSFLKICQILLLHYLRTISTGKFKVTAFEHSGSS